MKNLLMTTALVAVGSVAQADLSLTFDGGTVNGVPITTVQTVLDQEGFATTEDLDNKTRLNASDADSSASVGVATSGVNTSYGDANVTSSVNVHASGISSASRDFDGNSTSITQTEDTVTVSAHSSTTYPNGSTITTTNGLHVDATGVYVGDTSRPNAPDNLEKVATVEDLDNKTSSGTKHTCLLYTSPSPRDS